MGSKILSILARVVRPSSRRELGLNVLLVVVILISVGSVGYVLAQPPDESTSFYLLAEDGDGRLSATALPSNVTEGESMAITVGIDNVDRETYTVVVIGEHNDSGPGTIAQYRLEPGGDDSVREQIDVSVPNSRGRYQLSFLLYRGETPSSPAADTAYRTATHSVVVRSGEPNRIDSDQLEGVERP